MWRGGCDTLGVFVVVVVVVVVEPALGWSSGNLCEALSG